MRRAVGIVTLLGALVAFVFWAPGARAAQLVAGPSVTIGADERLDDELYATGNAIEIEGDVTRDVFAAGATVAISGRAGGDVTAAAGSVKVSGPIAGSLRVAAGTVEVTGPIGWDLVVLGAESVTVGRTATIAHDVATIGAETLTIDGTVRGNVRGNVGTLVVSGRIFGDVDVNANRVEIRDGAQIDGVFRYRAPQPATIAPGARIVGPQEYTPSPGTTGGPQTTLDRVLSWLSTVLLRLGWALVAGTLLVLALPRQTAQVADTFRCAPLWTIVWGVVAFVVVPAVALVLAVTVVGLSAALLLLGLYVAVLYLSQVLVGIALIRLVPLRAFRSERRLALWLVMVVGTTLVLVFRMLPIPFGWTFWWSLLIGALGLGMVWTALSGWGLRRVVPAAAAPAPSPVFEEAIPAQPMTTPPTEAHEEVEERREEH